MLSVVLVEFDNVLLPSAILVRLSNVGAVKDVRFSYATEFPTVPTSVEINPANANTMKRD
ncbi:hypothetical protein BH23THE1_BH23THE1_25770 [soil metagenome]